MKGRMPCAAWPPSPLELAADARCGVGKSAHDRDGGPAGRRSVSGVSPQRDYRWRRAEGVRIFVVTGETDRQASPAAEGHEETPHG